MRAPYPTFNPEEVEKSMRHLQKCLTALDKIASIDNGVISDLARAALQNKPLSLGGTVLDG